jgi:hypothetical protein
MTLPSYERLGVFYLGREYDPASQQVGTDLLYDSRDLTTHAVCIGMTGSGKTGLCLSLLEEAALDGVPAQPASAISTARHASVRADLVGPCRAIVPWSIPLRISRARPVVVVPRQCAASRRSVARCSAKNQP